MDKQTLLAILLIGLIFILWPFYQQLFLPPEDPRPGEALVEEYIVHPEDSTEALREETTTSEPERVVSRSASDIVAAAVDPPLSPRMVVVENDLYRGTISTAGGTIERWELKQYNHHQRDDERVQVVRHNEGNLGIRYLTMGGNTFDLAHQPMTIVGAADSGTVTVAFNGDSVATLLLRWDGDSGQRIEKEMRFYRDRYEFDMEVRLIGLQHSIAERRYVVYWSSGVPSSEGNKEDEAEYCKALALFGDELVTLEAAEPGAISDDRTGNTRWMGVRNKYFTATVIPRNQAAMGVTMTGRQLTGSPGYPERDYSVGLDLEYDHQPVVADRFTVYLGPIQYHQLRNLDAQMSEMIELSWRFLRPLSLASYHTFVFLHGLIPNYGVVILIFCVMIKILVYPLTHKSYESMKAMQDLAPKLNDLKEKYKDEPEKLSRATMALYKEEGVNPLGGCLPMVLQMPIFIAIYPLFYSTIEFRNEPFAWWITDLSLPDAVVDLPFSIPLYGDQFCILPILMGVSMLVQSLMTMKDPKQRMMVYMMPAMMLLIFNQFSSGLNLYWTAFNILSLIQQRIVHGKPHPVAAPVVTTPPRKFGYQGKRRKK